MEKKHRHPLRFIAFFAAVAAVLMLGSCRFDIILPLIGDGTSSATGTILQTETAVQTDTGTDTEADTETVGSEAETDTGTETETYTDTETAAPVITLERVTVPEEILPYGIDYIYDENMYDDERVTVSEGKDGCLYGVWTVTYEDGAESSRERTGEVRDEPVAKVVKTGVKPAYSTYFVTETGTAEFMVSTEYSGELYVGESYVKTAGVNGEVEHVYEVTAYHGAEVGRRLYSSTVTKAPVTQIVVYGTKVRLVTGTLAFPIPDKYAKTSCVSSWFGPRNLSISPYHYGIDFAVPQGTEVYAADGGVVREAYTWGQLAGTPSDSYGTYVLIQHVSEDGSTDMRTIYAHLSSLAVKAGDIVTKGQIVGYSGATGNVTGPHLHFELRLPVNGIYTSQKVNATDPKDYLPW